MLVVRAAKDWFLLIAQHWRATLPCFLGGALLYIGVAAWWPKAYTVTALMEPNPSVNWQPDIAIQKATENEAILEATTPYAWLGIADRLHLSPETAADGRLADATAALASQVSIQQVDDVKRGGPLVRVSYTAPSRDRALAVTQAVADNLANPGLAKPGLEGPSIPASPSPLRASTSASPAASPVKQAPPVGASFPQQARTPTFPAGTSSDPQRPVAQKQPTPPPSQTPSAELARQLQSRVDEGTKLGAAINENAASLTSLKQQLAQLDQKAAAAPPVAKNLPPQPERKSPAINPQIENLRQELAHNQQVLTDLQKRYTEDYPDVVAGKEKVRDLQIDISRLEAIDARTAQVVPPPQPAAQPPARDDSARNQVAQRLNQAQAVQDQLRQALDRNQAQQARLQSEIASEIASKTASSKSIDLPPAPLSQQSATPQVGQTTLPVVPPTAAVAAPSAAPPPSRPSPLTTGSPSAASASMATNRSATTGPSSPQLTSTPGSGNPLQNAPLTLAESPTIAVSPAYLSAPLSWLLSLVFGAFAALAVAWLAERRDPSIRSERMLRQVLPNSAAILGGIPRVRHEVIPE